MGELRAYALAVTEVRDVVGATGVRADRLRALAAEAFPPRTPPPAGLGPIHRRVPGSPVVRADDPTRADLEALLAGSPVPPARAAAVRRLVEALVAGLAWSSAPVTDDLPAGLLSPADLQLPALDGLTVRWCTLDAAAAVPGLHAWLAGADGWAEAAQHAGRPAPDLVVLGV